VSRPSGPVVPAPVTAQPTEPERSKAPRVPPPPGPVLAAGPVSQRQAPRVPPPRPSHAGPEPDLVDDAAPVDGESADQGSDRA
jgi:hypothetical protein